MRQAHGLPPGFARRAARKRGGSPKFRNRHRHKYELVVSELVEECRRGDAGQVARCKAFLAEASLLAIDSAILELAGRLVGPGLIPEEVAEDAIHVAAAAMHRCSFLLTWNFRHLANAVIRSRLERIVVEHGYGQLTICTPDELAGA